MFPANLVRACFQQVQTSVKEVSDFTVQTHPCFLKIVNVKRKRFKLRNRKWKNLKLKSYNFSLRKIFKFSELQVSAFGSLRFFFQRDKKEWREHDKKSHIVKKNEIFRWISLLENL